MKLLLMSTPPSTASPQPIVVDATKPSCSASRNTIELLVNASEVGGFLGATRVRLSGSHGGATPHLHRSSAEMFFVLEGHLQVLLDDEIVTRCAGDTLVVPCDTVHAFGAAPDATADALVTSPGVEQRGVLPVARSHPARPRGQGRATSARSTSSTTTSCRALSGTTPATPSDSSRERLLQPRSIAMRKIITSTYATLDGYIDDPHLSSMQYSDTESQAYAFQTTIAADALLLGRTTYDGMAQAWPSMGGNPYADHVNSMTKYVVASQPVDTSAWDPTVVIAGSTSSQRSPSSRHEMAATS